MEQRFHIKYIVISILLLVFGCYSPKPKRILSIGKGNTIDYARLVAISDYSKRYQSYKSQKKALKSNYRKLNVFRVVSDETSKEYYVFRINPILNNHVSLGIEDSLGKIPRNNFPNNFEISNKMLFVWKDSIKPLTRPILKALDKFKKLDSTDLKLSKGSLAPDFVDTRYFVIDHSLQSVRYYMCKNQIKKYKRILGTRAPDKLPKLRCTRWLGQ